MATKKAKPEKTAIAGPIPQDDLLALATKKADTSKLIAQLRVAPCDSVARYEWFSSQLGPAIAFHQGVDDQRTKITKPILEAKSAADKIFMPLIKLGKEVESIIRGKLNDYDRARLRAQEAALLAASTAAATGDTAAVNAAIDIVTANEVEASGHTATKTYSFVVHDLGEVPDWAKCLDPKAVQDYVDHCVKNGTVPSLGGIVFEIDVKQRKKST